jgi:hypothetical protein
MSKKHKRSVSRQDSRQVSRPLPTLAGKTTVLNPDYSTIKHELRRIGILAGTFFAILIILAIFQNQILALFSK